MREKYVIFIENDETRKEKTHAKHVGIFYSRKKANERMREYYAQEVEKLLKTMSAEEFNKNYMTIIKDDFIDLFERNSANMRTVFVSYLIKVEDAG